MIYALVREPLLALLRVPREAPDAPAGSHASVQVFRASPRFLGYRLLALRLLTGVLALAAFVALVASLVAGEAEATGAVVLLAAIVFPLLFLLGLLVRVDYDLRYYVVTDRSLRVREGAWNVREMTITFANVQNMRLVQGPLMRLFHISHLKIDVAGGGAVQAQHAAGGGHQVNVAGIENATELRDLILGHQRRVHTGAGLGDPEDDPRRVARVGGLSGRALAALEGVAAAAAALSATARRLRATRD